MTLGFVFPGQGSQSIGMMNAFADAYPHVRDTFALASEVLGYDLWQITAHGPEEALNRTATTQPAMLAAGYAVWQTWKAAGGPPPAIAAGHSLGEYTALVCADALEFTDAVRIVAARGQFMQDAVGPGEGAMAAVLGLHDAEVIALCREAADGQTVEAVNFNSPGQVVIAGHSAAVARAVELAKTRGARRSIKLPVSVPSHCALMRQAAQRLAALLEEVEIRIPAFAILNNVDVDAAREPAAIRTALVRQLDHPVRWVETIQKMAQQGVDTVLELGPGKVLSGLNKRIDRGLRAFAVCDPDSLTVALEELRQEKREASEHG